MTVIVLKHIFSLYKSKHVISLSTVFFSSSSLKVSSTFSHLKIPQRTDLILSCLNQTGFSSPQIDQMIKKYPQILKKSPETLKAKLKILHDIGFSISDTIDIFSKHPFILQQCSENRIRTSITALKFVLGSTEAVCKVLKRFSWFLNNNLDKTMIPNFEYLMNCSGLIFLLRPEMVGEGARRVHEMGLEWTPKMYLRAVSVVCSLSPVNLGFSDHDVSRVFNQYPKIFLCSEKKMKKTMEVLLNSGRTDTSSLAVEHAKLLLYSLEKRIKPRFKIVEALKERGLLPRKLGLYTILEMSNKKFLEKLVISNLDALANNIQKQAGKVSPEMTKAKLRIFHDNGISTSNTIDILSRHPRILNQCSESRIKTSIASLRFFLGSTEDFCRVLKKHCWILKSDLDKTMIPNIEYLMNRSELSCSKVADHLIKYPRTFLLRPETVAEGTRRVDEMGLEWTPYMYLRAVSMMCSLSPVTLELKKNNFLGLGFSEREVLVMFSRYPKVFSCSEKKIKETMEVLLSSGRTDRLSLASKTTGLLLYSLKKRIKPRLAVFNALEDIGLLPRKLRLSTILTMANNKFLECYVH